MGSLVFTELLLYLTSLWASVPTKVILSSFNSQKIPIIFGLSSSLPVAKIVFEIAFCKMFAGISKLRLSSIVLACGYSSPLKQCPLYSPSAAENLMLALPSSSIMANTIGVSDINLSVSNNVLEGTATEPSPSTLFKSITALIVQSKSEAVTVNLSPLIVNKKLSKMGILLLLLNTPLIALRFL